jgi:hypothetical protein
MGVVTLMSKLGPAPIASLTAGEPSTDPGQALAEALQRKWREGRDGSPPACERAHLGVTFIQCCSYVSFWSSEVMQHPRFAPRQDPPQDHPDRHLLILKLPLYL